LITATFLPNADAAVSSSRSAFRLRPKLELTSPRMISRMATRQPNDSQKK
jgi:hypothetical protein